uniref:Uncharacterized protein n=1 Tax=Salix viminalis TaxID=40686 RepID=A0A6N2LRN1_SALVM
MVLRLIQPTIFGSYKHPNKGRVPKLVNREQHIPTRSFFRKLLYFGSILIAKKFSCESIIPKFQGQIPAEIEAYLPGLQVLLMSDNGFDGSLQG